MHALKHKIQAYLLWLQDRGIHRPLVSQATLAGIAAETKNEACEDQATEALSLLDDRSNTAPIPELITLRGGSHPKFLCFIHHVFGQNMTNPQQRKLLLGIMKALSDDVKNDFCVAGIALDRLRVPLAEKNVYQEQIKAAVEKLQPKYLLSFGSQSSFFLAENKQAFLDIKNREQNSFLDQKPFYPLWSLDNLLEHASYKRETWNTIKNL